MVVQGEPEFDRLKRELEDVKNAPRGLEGTFRSAAEMERHRAAAADAAIEEQLEVQTSFRQHGARLQVPTHPGVHTGTVVPAVGLAAWRLLLAVHLPWSRRLNNCSASSVAASRYPSALVYTCQ